MQRPESYGITLILPCPASLPSPTYRELKQHVSSVTEHLCSSFVIVTVCVTFKDIYGAVRAKTSAYDPMDTTFIKLWTNQMTGNKLWEITGVRIDVNSKSSFLCFVFVSN